MKDREKREALAASMARLAGINIRLREMERAAGRAVAEISALLYPGWKRRPERGCAMSFSRECLDALERTGVPRDDGLAYLLAVRYELRPSYIPPDIPPKMVKAGLVSADGRLLLPTAEDRASAFAWVLDEYVPIFTASRPDMRMYAREALPRMRALFSERPEVRRDEVLGATALYVRSTEPAYLMRPHYFIRKGVGASATQTLLGWVEEYRRREDGAAAPHSERRRLL